MFITEVPAVPRHGASRGANRGFTIVEFLVALTVAFIALAGIGAFTIFTARSFGAMSNYMELDKNSRNALDRMTQIVREADGVTDYSQHSIVLSYHSQRLSFDYSPDTKKLVLTETNNTTRTLLEDCDYLDFEVFQRNSVSGTYDQYPAAVDESAAKLVQVSWICSRRLIGNLLNTESVQSAKIVIRKQ
jgi:Tfp pilus assembly protein PilW